MCGGLRDHLRSTPGDEWRGAAAAVMAAITAITAVTTFLSSPGALSSASGLNRQLKRCVSARARARTRAHSEKSCSWRGEELLIETERYIEKLCLEQL